MKYPKYDDALCNWKCPFLRGNVTSSSCTGQLEFDRVVLKQTEEGVPRRCERCLERYTEKEPDGIKTLFSSIRSDLNVLADKCDKEGDPDAAVRLREISEDYVWEVQETVFQEIGDE